MACKQLGFYAVDAFTERYGKFGCNAHKHSLHKYDINCSCYNLTYIAYIILSIIIILMMY